MDRTRWSPDGEQLAFVAARDGPSSDIYLFDLPSRRLRRLTSGPNQSASLSWSPDGRWIAHQSVESFGTGAGWKMGSVWAVAADGSDLNKLYEPASGGEVFVDWSKGDSLIRTRSHRRSHDLRAAGAEGSVENVLVPSYFNDAAYDPESGTVAYAVPLALGSTGSESGAYLWRPTWYSTKRIDAGDWSDVQWAEGARRFFFDGPAGVLAVDPNGETVDRIPMVDRVSPSPDGTVVALWGDGYSGRAPDLKLLTGSGGTLPLRRGISFVLWRLDSAGLWQSARAVWSFP
jgi:dipeptidyl aminopeptidase/acylaminoacyl peptidase